MGYQEDFINQIAPHIQAWRNYLGWGVASAIIAQACHECGYGRDNKAKNYHNYFGLKYKDNRVSCNDGYFTDTSHEVKPDGTIVKITTKWFSFPDMHSGVQGYYQFVDYPRYSEIKTAKDPLSYFNILKAGGYATGMIYGNYIERCMELIQKYNLTQYDEVKPMYTNSPLVTYTDITDHNYGLRSHAIDTVTIHHMAGNLSVQTCGNLFHRKNGSSNYGINGKDIALYVPESNGAWTSSNKANDMRAITIECANDILAPYWTISADTMTSLINLLADICKRNNIPALVWSDNKQDRINHRNGCNMTLHKDFSSTACPGPFLSGPGMMAAIAEAVNAQIASGASSYIINGLDYEPVFDPDFYYNKYPDLQLAIGYNKQGLWEHFKNFGMNEARQGAAEFDPKYYRSHYADLDAVFHDDWFGYYTHYIMFGKNEGRKGAP